MAENNNLESSISSLAFLGKFESQQSAVVNPQGNGYSLPGMKSN